MSDKVAQRQIVAKIVSAEGDCGVTSPTIDGWFAQVTGGEVTAAVEKVYDGGEILPDVLAGPAEVGDVTLTRHFEVDGGRLDNEKLKELRHVVGMARYTINVHVMNCGLVSSVLDRQYQAALLVGITEPEGDSASGAPATFSLTFAIGKSSKLPVGG